MAGVLLYTAAPDSEGTLGGLVSLGEPDQLGPLLRQALERAQLCSSDPLCSEHDPRTDASVHAAACHACQFASETSCERGNRFLDRAALVRTLGARRRRLLPVGVTIDDAVAAVLERLSDAQIEALAAAAERRSDPPTDFGQVGAGAAPSTVNAITTLHTAGRQPPD